MTPFESRNTEPKALIIAILIWGFLVLSQLTLVGLFIYVAYHFISKHW